ncbi:hypothetical protein M426DRAFT_58221 [Hypoxylon sp. CI-4A]|nr:hypothetical protein M426DRAFT_58221 [Hypoxylon sp. CI-4A]
MFPLYPSSPHLPLYACVFLAIVVATVLIAVLYRLTAHPLARFPGPLLAASTGLYEAYYQCIKDGGGRYWVEIEKMHERYGPIVRINPWEIHIADPDWNAVYKYSAKSSKPPWFYLLFFGQFPSTNVAESHALHQLRRAPLQVYFASTNIQRYMPTIVAQVDKLCQRLRNAAEGNGSIVSLSDAFRCLATDVATGFAFGTPFGHLDEPMFDREFNLSVRTIMRAGILSRHSYGLFLQVLHNLPESIAKRVNPAFGRTMTNCVRRSMNKPEPAPGSPYDMVQTLMGSTSLPAEEKTFPRLFSESRSVIMAGTETTATTLVCIASNLLGDPAKLQKLRRELLSAAETAKEGGGGRQQQQQQQQQQPLEYADLRELPYLTGVINEGLRLANPTPSRLPRVCEDQDLKYKQWVIPEGTTISRPPHPPPPAPGVSPQPRAFRPERWADADAGERRRLGRHLLPWGRGARQCLGVELATVDMYLAVSRLFGPGSAGFDMRPHDTEDADWEPYHEWFAAFPRGRGLRVLVTRAGAGAGQGQGQGQGEG